MKTLPDTSVDLFLCDLPYGCLSSPSKPVPGVDCNWDVKIDLPQFWEQIKRLAKTDHTPVLMFCSTKFGAELITSNPSWFRYDLVWNKSRGVSFLQANKMPLRSHEMIYVFAKKGAAYYRKDIEGDFKGVSMKGTRTGHTPFGAGLERTDVAEGRRCVKSVIDVASKSGRGNHPTQKPDDLYEWLITRYSKEGDTILDPTAGSFASVFTAHRLNRNAIGIEKDTTFYEDAIRRQPPS